MKSNLIKISTLLMTLIILCFNILAGDIPEALMEGNQKALFIGEIKEIQEAYYTLIPITVMMGTIEEDALQVHKFETYYGTDEVPQEGDYIVAVLLDEQQVDDQWLFKATSSAYETLKLVSEKYNMVERYETYINQGDYFDAQRKLDEEREVQLEVVEEIQESHTMQAEVETIHKYEDNKWMFIGLGSMGIIGIIGIIVVILAFIKRKGI